MNCTLQRFVGKVYSYIYYYPTLFKLKTKVYFTFCFYSWKYSRSWEKEFNYFRHAYKFATQSISPFMLIQSIAHVSRVQTTTYRMCIAYKSTIHNIHFYFRAPYDQLYLFNSQDRVVWEWVLITFLHLILSWARQSHGFLRLIWCNYKSI